MSHDSDRFIDPKTSFLLSLIHEMDQISWELRYGSPFQAAKNLSILIDRIDYPASNEQMVTIEKQMDLNHLGRLTNVGVKDAVKIVNRYLNQTYFKGFKGIIKDQDFDELKESDDSESQMDSQS